MPHEYHVSYHERTSYLCNCMFRLTGNNTPILRITDDSSVISTTGYRWILATKNQLCGNCVPLQWRHNGCDGVSNHQPHECLLERLLRRRSKKASKLLVTGLCEGNSPVAGEFPAQMASNAENVSIWWRHHAYDDVGMLPVVIIIADTSGDLLQIVISVRYCHSSNLQRNFKYCQNYWQEMNMEQLHGIIHIKQLHKHPTSAPKWFISNSLPVLEYIFQTKNRQQIDFDFVTAVYYSQYNMSTYL